MTKRASQPKSRAKAKGSPARPRTKGKSQPKITWDEWLISATEPWRKEIAGILLVIWGSVTLLAIAGLLPGKLLTVYAAALKQAVGWGSWIVALSLIMGGLHVALDRIGRPWNITLPQIIGFEFTFLTSLALTHLTSAADPEKALFLAANGRGGGYLGWALAVPLVEGVGLILAWMILGTLWCIGIGVILGISRQDVQDWLNRIAGELKIAAENLKPEEMPEKNVPLQPELPGITKQEPPPQKRVPRVEAQQMVISKPNQRKAAPSKRPTHLPSLDLLEPGVMVEQSEEEIKRKAAIIENTLQDFGLPARVVEVRRGPVVTQFGVAPQYIEKAGANGEVREQKVRVSQITSLSRDLALALASPRIRMEAPVPGRPIVGIEVPNQQNVMVHLRPVVESEAFFKIKSPLTVGLGLDVSGAPVAADLVKMPHLLIAGTTGSGKSVCINTITTCLVMNNQPERLGLVMIDPKMVELVRFNGLPHLLGKVEVELDRVIGVLRWMTHEMDERYTKLAEFGVRNIADFNRLARRRKSLAPLRYIVLIIDELADLMMMAPEEVERTLVRLAQMARAVGIHLVVATQRPSTDVVTGLIKANFPARIAFSVASSTDSRVILDSVGAETLLGRGDMLFQAPDSPKPVRLQGCFVSDLEIDRVVSTWRDQENESESKKEAPWESFLARQAVVEDKDPMLEQAIALAQNNESVSTSFIQRKLRVGFPRAARLMDALEDLGVVGGEQVGGRARDVLVESDDDPLGDYASNQESD